MTDLHLLEYDLHLRSSRSFARLSFLGLGRPVDAADRFDRAVRAIRDALACNPDHLLVTGDLTEDGHAGQFEVLADVLRAAGADGDCTTLVAGNHDGYTRLEAFEAALHGPLRAYARTSAPGAIVQRDDVAIAAVPTVIQQPLIRSAGIVTRGQVDALAVNIASTDPEMTWVLAMHHGPWSGQALLGTWWDGLLGQEHLVELLVARENAFVAHGHTHKRAARSAVKGRGAQVFCAEAAVDSASPVRMYLAGAGMFFSVQEPVSEPASARVAVAA